MYDACKALEKLDQNRFCRSIRVLIPRLLGFLYEVRNNRGVGHVGGDVDPNLMDATCVVSSVKWVMAELVRLFHQVSTDAATGAVNAITQREIQLVWDVNDKKRVLPSGINMKESVMLLLYSCLDGSATEQQLLEWTEHSNKAVFKKNVLMALHKSRYVEYDRKLLSIKLSPTGIKYVEDNLLK